MSEDCIFCKIVAGEIPSDEVYQDELVYAFRDINPAAPVHVLVIPKQHLVNTNALDEAHKETAAAMLLAAPKIAAQEGIAETGYRVIMNNGPDGRQEVLHLHLHLLGGGRMQHPMG
jgi:histidine triad (HIT) family protein